MLLLLLFSLYCARARVSICAQMQRMRIAFLLGNYYRLYRTCLHWTHWPSCAAHLFIAFSRMCTILPTVRLSPVARIRFISVFFYGDARYGAIASVLFYIHHCLICGTISGRAARRRGTEWPLIMATFTQFRNGVRALDAQADPILSDNGRPELFKRLEIARQHGTKRFARTNGG